MKRWLGLVAVAFGCGGDDQGGNGDGGVDALVTHGAVTVYAQPGVRVDFMSGATDQVISSGVTDATGKIEGVIDLGDRAVIVEPSFMGMFGGVVVLDQLEPAQEYRWFLEQETPVGVFVTASWAAPATAVEYKLSSRCGGQSGFVNTTTRMIQVCGPGDEILVTAFNAALVSLGSARQVVPPSSGGEAVAITAPFVADQDVEITLATPPLGGGGDIDASATLITPMGLTFGDALSLSPSSPTAIARLPALAGDLRTYATVAVPGRGLKWIIDRRAIASTIALDVDGITLPYVQSAVTHDAAASTMSWTQVGEGTPTAVSISYQDATMRRFVLVTRSAGPSVELPALPPDVVPVPVPTTVAPVIMASPGGYAATIRAFANARHPFNRDYTLYFSTLFGST